MTWLLAVAPTSSSRGRMELLKDYKGAGGEGEFEIGRRRQT